MLISAYRVVALALVSIHSNIDMHTIPVYGYRRIEHKMSFALLKDVCLENTKTLGYLIRIND